ncbi:protocadherin-11 Y-linked-like [Babylonia areolata]|uniref:protocadherin-11 Y-linked-like n=1 Tax=Babylonia areolata TaxID=304850 RepID=UPI003FD05297
MEVTSDDAFPLVTFWHSDCHCPLHMYPDGSVALTRSLMSEPVTSYSLDAYVTDGVSRIGPSTLYLIVTDVNHAPQYVDNPLFVTVEENSAGVVLTVNVTDAEGDAVRISLAWSPEEAGNLFWFNETDRAVQIRQFVALDFEHLADFGLTRMTATFAASDGFKTSSADVVIVISDVNEPPICSQASFFVSCDEGKEGRCQDGGRGHAYGCECSLCCMRGRMDGCGWRQETWSNVSLGRSRDQRDVIGRTLRLREGRQLDYESHPVHVIHLVADNGRLTSDPATLTLDVMDVNEAPVFLQDHVNVTVEGRGAGTVALSTLRDLVRDPDIHDTHTFSLLTSTRIFSIHPASAVISLAADYDASGDVTPGEVTLKVMVTDSGQLSSTTEVHVAFVNKNQRPRLVNLPREITVPEDMNSGGVIYRVIAEDPDGDDVVVRMSASDGNGKIFLFNETDGTLLLRESQNFDFETTQRYVLRFIADDGVLTSAPSTLTLLVDDVNEAPYFTSAVFYVSAPEGHVIPGDTEEGTLLYTVYAEDGDGDPLVFRFTTLTGDRRREWFHMNSSTGEVYLVSRPPLHPHHTTHHLHVSVTDGLLSSQAAILAITVAGSAEGTSVPVVTSAPYVINVREDEMIGRGTYHYLQRHQAHARHVIPALSSRLSAAFLSAFIEPLKALLELCLPSPGLTSQ